MNKSSLNNFNVTNKKKIWFMIPAVILIIAVAFGMIYGFSSGNPLNLSMDFSDGYSISVSIGTNLNNDTRDDYESQIRTIFGELKDADGNAYGLSVEKFTLRGADGSAALNIYYKAVAPELEMNDINKELKEYLDDGLFAGDTYLGEVYDSVSIGPSVSMGIILSTASGMLLALLFVLIYLAIRFDVLSGVIAVICNIVNMLIMFAFAVIFHMPISVATISALLAMCICSLIASVIVFDKIRVLVKLDVSGNRSHTKIANEAVKSILSRFANIIGIMLVIVLAVAVMSFAFFVEGMMFFGLLLLAGLVFCAFSSIFIAPSLWAAWQERKPKVSPKSGSGKKAPSPEKNADGEKISTESVSI